MVYFQSSGQAGLQEPPAGGLDPQLPPVCTAGFRTKVRYGTVRYGTVQYGIARHCTVRYHVYQIGTISYMSYHYHIISDHVSCLALSKASCNLPQCGQPPHQGPPNYSRLRGLHPSKSELKVACPAERSTSRPDFEGLHPSKCVCLPAGPNRAGRRQLQGIHTLCAYLYLYLYLSLSLYIYIYIYMYMYMCIYICNIYIYIHMYTYCYYYHHYHYYYHYYYYHYYIYIYIYIYI